MSVKFVSVALLVTVLGSLTALAQTVSEVGGPKEQPPAGFAGMQYIDSRGCVFLRAGMGGEVKWVPRVGQDRKVLCGYPPTLGGKAVAAAPEVAVAEPAAQPAPSPAPKPAAVAAVIPEESYVPPPARVGKPIPTQAPAPLVVAVKPGQAVAPVAGRVGCPASAPRLQRLALTNGGTVLVCTPGDGVLRDLRPPIFADGAGVGAAFDDAPPAPEVAAVTAKPRPLGQAPAAKPGAARLAADATAPAGYVQAWKDDRLNPLRGVGTAAGQAAQDQVWTRKTPARLVGDTPRARRQAAKERLGLAYAAPEAGSRLVVSTMSAPAAGLYVQVGSFGVPANAAGAAARLAAAGLPVAQGRAKGLQVVMAGPFGSRAEAAAALGVARAQGFGDAFVR